MRRYSHQEKRKFINYFDLDKVYNDICLEKFLNPNFLMLSLHNPNITWEIVKANPDKRWNYAELSQNPNITWEIIQAHLDKSWDYDWLSLNPNITWDIVKNNPKKNGYIDYYHQTQI